jgi:hypothetical protein
VSASRAMRRKEAARRERSQQSRCPSALAIDLLLHTHAHSQCTRPLGCVSWLGSVRNELGVGRRSGAR